MVIITGSWNLHTVCAPVGEETAERQMITDMEALEFLETPVWDGPQLLAYLAARLFIHKLI